MNSEKKGFNVYPKKENLQIINASQVPSSQSTRQSGVTTFYDRDSYNGKTITYTSSAPKKKRTPLRFTRRFSPAPKEVEAKLRNIDRSRDRVLQMSLDSSGPIHYFQDSKDLEILFGTKYQDESNENNSDVEEIIENSNACYEETISERGNEFDDCLPGCSNSHLPNYDHVENNYLPTANSFHSEEKFPQDYTAWDSGDNFYDDFSFLEQVGHEEVVETSYGDGYQEDEIIESTCTFTETAKDFQAANKHQTFSKQENVEDTIFEDMDQSDNQEKSELLDEVENVEATANELEKLDVSIDLELNILSSEQPRDESRSVVLYEKKYYCENADLDMLIKRIRLLDCFDKSHTDFLLPLLQLAGNDKISEVYEIEKFYVEQFIPALENWTNYRENPTEFFDTNADKFEEYYENEMKIETPLSPNPEIFPFQIELRNRKKIEKEIADVAENQIRRIEENFRNPFIAPFAFFPYQNNFQMAPQNVPGPSLYNPYPVQANPAPNIPFNVYQNIPFNLYFNSYTPFVNPFLNPFPFPFPNNLNVPDLSNLGSFNPNINFK
ncbi:GON-4-like protein [Caenorhabditis elegans]|uniref:GON-4-like protein n=1 Tax=Caenorhabditis elegans TaxID=6239 RepID=A0A486WUQ0_CAEEL|nr:GON-4-like protein [Caenorhabditis elegans]VGM69523.1 GON-4-like protein [Caenorhabditis elegans]